MLKNIQKEKLLLRMMPFDSHGLFQWHLTFQEVFSSANRLGKPAYLFVVVC
jgi:hypothetical protein